MKKISRARFIAAALLASAAAFGGTARAYDPPRVLNVMKHPRDFSAHVVLISHRGIVGSGCPENSYCSISRTVHAGVEAIELDVKRSASGTLWLMHDQNLGRMTEPRFNMYKKAGPNPDISTLTDRQIQYRVLLDRNFSATNNKMLRLDEALNYTKGLLVILDLKTAGDTALAANVVKRMGAYNRVILKVNAAWFPTLNSVENYTKGLPWAMALYSNSIDAIYLANRNSIINTPRAALSQYFDQVFYHKNAVFFEIGNKEQADRDPTGFLVNLAANSTKATSQFIPYPEYPSASTIGGLDLRYGYVRSDSSCCADLTDYLTRTTYFGKEYVDNRPFIMDNGGWAAFDSLLTDNVSTVGSELGRRGRRKINYYSTASRNWQY